MPEPILEESLGGLVRDILRDVRTLIREGLSLARLELREQVGHARTAAIGFGVAAAALAFGVAFLLIAIATAIADGLNWPVWAGFLLVAGVLAVTGFATLAFARRTMRHVHAIPTETVSTLKENSAWIAKRLSSGRK